jgi:hypothetical protein
MVAIDKKVENTIASHTAKFCDTKTKELEQAMSEFKELVKKGIATERGYNLEGIEKSHIKHVSFNVSK